jgi:hypothetical protein
LIVKGLRGLLAGKTRVVVLNSHLHFLPFFDRIFVMEEDTKAQSRADAEHAHAQKQSGSSTASIGNGKEQKDSQKVRSSSGFIAASGTYRELMAMGKYTGLLQASPEPERSPQQQEAADEKAAISGGEKIAATKVNGKPKEEEDSGIIKGDGTIMKKEERQRGDIDGNTISSLSSDSDEVAFTDHVYTSYFGATSIRSSVVMGVLLAFYVVGWFIICQQRVACCLVQVKERETCATFG